MNLINCLLYCCAYEFVVAAPAIAKVWVALLLLMLLWCELLLGVCCYCAIFFSVHIVALLHLLLHHHVIMSSLIRLLLLLLVWALLFDCVCCCYHCYFCALLWCIMVYLQLFIFFFSKITFKIFLEYYGVTMMMMPMISNHHKTSLSCCLLW